VHYVPAEKGDFMRFRTALLASAIGLSWVASPAAAQQHSLAEDAKAFGAREAVSGVLDLSPDGNSVMYLTPGPGRKIVAVVGDLNSGQFRTMASSEGSRDAQSLDWCHFAAADRAICEFSGLAKRPDTGDLLSFTRLIAMGIDGGNAKLLGQPATGYDSNIRQFDTEVIDWLVDSTNQVLVSRLYVPEEGKMNTNIVRNKKGWGVDRIDATTLKGDSVEPPKEAASYMTDGLGHVRIMALTDSRNSGMLTGNVRYFYRTQNSRDWKDLYSGNDQEFTPVSVDSSIDSLYVLKKKDGRDALYTVKLDGSQATALVAENPRVDISDVIRFGEGQKVIGYADSDQNRSYFDPEFSALAASLSKALPKSPIIQFIDASRDGNKLLVFAGSDSDPGRYYVFDRAHKALTPAMIARPELEGRALASVRSVTVTAPDGTAIPAYLTLPPGKEAKNLPAVVLPHGGPSDRDVWGFDWLPQFLAARGYAVLQPQYRGSAGFGDAWLNKNGFQSWRTSIGDVTASAKWLAAQGIADANKLAILGWSYGGYAALQSAVTEPSLYKAAIAIAPVTDLQMAEDESRNFTNYELVRKEIGSGPHVIEGSPLRHAAAISVPVLLVHGTMDDTVRIAESEKMDAALHSAGKQSELLTFAGLDHQLKDSDARTQMLTKIGELLERTIGR
jgi:dipeptidyl aminopeptidase/acylaminoacyl peptidase